MQTLLKNNLDKMYPDKFNQDYLVLRQFREIISTFSLGIYLDFWFWTFEFEFQILRRGGSESLITNVAV